MKLLLIQPPVQDFYDTDIRLQPIGLAYLKAAVKKHLPGIEVVIRDFHHGHGRKTIPVPEELAYLRDYYRWPDKSPFSSFYHYYHFGADFATLAAEVEKEAPDLVGISALFSPYYREALMCARSIKERMEVPIIAGGAHVSALPGAMLAQPEIDYVIRGEGERPLVEFLKAFQTGANYGQVPNLGFKRDGELILNPVGDNDPIESLPVPDLSDFSPKDYLFEKEPLCFVITSRSCPHRCSFCSVHHTFGHHYRRRRVADVLAEIEARYEEGYRVFDFEDDNLTFYREEMKDLCRGLIRIFAGRKIRFLAMNGISYLSLDGELLELMKKAGFTHLNLALVSSDESVRETTKRPHTVEKYAYIVSRAHELGFQIVSYQILGLPGESLESMIQTLVFSARQPVLLGASLFYLTPASPIARDLGHVATETDVFRSRLSAMAIETKDCDRDDLYTLFVTTRVLNFLKGLRPESEAGNLGLLLESAANEGGRSAVGVEVLRKILAGEGLYAATGKGRKMLPRFRQSLFDRIWSSLECVTTCRGERIRDLNATPARL